MIRAIVKMTVAAAAVGGLQFGAVAPSEAQTGFLCGFASITDPTVEGGPQVGEVHGGPLFAADVDHPGEEAATIQIVCTIQVGAQGAVHSGANAAVAASTAAPAVTVLPSTQISYTAPTGSPVYLCSSAVVNGQTRYWDSVNDPNDATDGGWQTTNGHDCLLAISQEVTAPECRDGVDNDLDGQTDYPNDPQCADGEDNDESA